MSARTAAEKLSSEKTFLENSRYSFSIINSPGYKRATGVCGR